MNPYIGLATQQFAPAGAGATLVLNGLAARVVSVTGLVGSPGAPANLQAVNAAIGTGPPAGTGAQFTGTAQAPSAQVMLGNGWTANSLVTVTYVPAGAVAADV